MNVTVTKKIAINPKSLVKPGIEMMLAKVKGAQAAQMEFVNGQTEVWLEPPAGK